MTSTPPVAPLRAPPNFKRAEALFDNVNVRALTGEVFVSLDTSRASTVQVICAIHDHLAARMPGRRYRLVDDSGYLLRASLDIIGDVTVIFDT
jgi:hypothetical protein